MQGGDSQRDGELKFPVAKVNQLPRQRLTARKYALQLHGRLQSRPIFETRRRADWLENKGRARRSVFLSAKSVSTGGSDFFRAGTTHTHTLTHTHKRLVLYSVGPCLCLSVAAAVPPFPASSHPPHSQPTPPVTAPSGKAISLPPLPASSSPVLLLLWRRYRYSGRITGFPRFFYSVFARSCPGYLILHPPPPNPSRQWVATRSPHKLFQVQRAGLPACLPPLPSLVRSPVER